MSFHQNKGILINPFALINFQVFIILGGLWFSKEKPTMSTFMKPFVQKLNKLYHEGRCMHVVMLTNPLLNYYRH